MKSDIDALMAERGFEALFVMGEAGGNHILRYLAGGVKVTHAWVLKQRGADPVIICNPMERDEAAKGGLTVLTTNEFRYMDLIKEAGGYFEGEIQLIKAVFERFEVSGAVAFYGLMDPGKAHLMLSRLAEQVPNITVTGEGEITLFDEAVTSKDPAEIAALKSVAERTNRVMGEVIDFVAGHDVVDETLVQGDGTPLTVRDVKDYLRGRLMEAGLNDNENTIFALGRDAGVPHSRGEYEDILRLGVPIIFDLFPCALDSGYYHDMTRTLCFGFAPEEVQRAYEQVMQAFDTVMDAITVGEQAATYQEMVCDVFEEHGHPTPRSNPGTEQGYVHSVAHGLGLQIHERPRFGSVSEDVIKHNQVFTVEPGLYYPDRGYGIRVEDTVFVNGDGQVESWTPYPKDLVIPMRSETD